MPKPPRAPNHKIKSLAQSGTLNPKPEEVTHRLFEDSSFFDPNDLVQIKYETIRAIERNESSISQAAAEFGLSRPTIYAAKRNFEANGMPGLLPEKRGPRAAHKLTDAIVDEICLLQKTTPSLRTQDLLEHIRKKFGLRVHRRSLERALRRKEKKGRQE